MLIVVPVAAMAVVLDEGVVLMVVIDPALGVVLVGHRVTSAQGHEQRDEGQNQHVSMRLHFA